MQFFHKFPECIIMIIHMNTCLRQYKMMNMAECLPSANSAGRTNPNTFIFSSGLREKKLKITFKH